MVVKVVGWGGGVGRRGVNCSCEDSFFKTHQGKNVRAQSVPKASNTVYAKS